MIEIGNLIPSIDALMRRCQKPQAVQPSRDALNEFESTMRRYGYTRQNPEVYDEVLNYGALMLDRTNYKGLFLKGDVGIGKSYGVEIIAARFNIPVFTPAIFLSLYKSLNGNLLELENIVRTGNDFFGEPKDIVIDELGTKDSARNFGETADIMCDVLEMRYRAYVRDGVKTIVTTNLDDAELSRRYGVRIDDRLNEMFSFKTVHGSSLRK